MANRRFENHDIFLLGQRPSIQKTLQGGGDEKKKESRRKGIRPRLKRTENEGGEGQKFPRRGTRKYKLLF